MKSEALNTMNELVSDKHSLRNNSILHPEVFLKEMSLLCFQNVKRSLDLVFEELCWE